MDTSLAPGYARVTYDGVLFPHHMTIPINFDGTPTPGVEPDLLLKDASSLGAEAAIGALVDVIKPAFKTTVHFGLCEIHAVDGTTGLDTFIYAFNLARLGTDTGVTVAMSEVVFSFKTTIGSAYKLYLLEGTSPVNTRTLPPYGAGWPLTLSDFVVGSSSPVYGRKNAYPFVPVSMIAKTNDKLRKQQGLT
jgi:hypothetical protein